MTNDIQTKPTAREQQKAMARLLAALLEHDLPPAYWVISQHSDELRGLVASSDNDVEKRRQVAAWAEHFKTEVVEERKPKYTEVAASAVVDGIRVEIFALADETKAAAS